MALRRLLASWRLLRGARSGGCRGRGDGRYGARARYAGSRVHVVGCAPGCQVTSLLLSVALTVLLNPVLLNLILRLF